MFFVSSLRAQKHEVVLKIDGKIVEVAVKNVIDGNPITNLEALANPSALDEYKNINELKF